VPWTAGKEYLDGHQKVDGTAAKGAIVYPADGRRNIISGFALEKVDPPASTSVSQILAWPLWSKKQGLVLLANFTGQPSDEVKVTISTRMTVRSVQSLRHGKLRFRRPQFGSIECTLPVRDVTDMLIVNE
jgi:hypothetical protein